MTDVTLRCRTCSYSVTGPDREPLRAEFEGHVAAAPDTHAGVTPEKAYEDAWFDGIVVVCAKMAAKVGDSPQDEPL